MASITREIQNILKSDAAIQKDLARNLINTRALARYIIKRYNLSASLDSAISAIRRFESEEEKEHEKTITNLFKDCIITTKNNIACVTLSKEAEKNLPLICTVKDLNANGAFRIITGSKNIKIIADEEKMKTIVAHFQEKLIQKIQKNLSELSIILNEKAIKTKGVLAKIAGEISLANINIEEMITCPPEFLIYVAQDNILKTYETILKIREKNY